MNFLDKEYYVKLLTLISIIFFSFGLGSIITAFNLPIGFTVGLILLGLSIMFVFIKRKKQ